MLGIPSGCYMLCKKQNDSLCAGLVVKQGEAGQILLIVILVIIVTLTIGLSAVSRSVTSLRTSTEEEESQKALSAAEAGIERAIQGNSSISSADLGNNSSYNTNVSSVNGSELLINGGVTIPKDEGADLWLSTYSSVPDSNYGNPQSGNVTIYWGDSATACNNSALEIITISGSKSNPVLKKYAYDPCFGRSNGFSLPSGGGAVGGKTFFHSATISVSSGLFARIIPIYGNTSAGVKGNFIFPNQGYKIDSYGTSGLANRKITVFKGWPQTYLPYLSYGLFVVN